MNHDLALNLWELLAILFGVFTAGGFTAITFFGMVSRRVHDNPALMRAIERAADNVPRETADRILQFAESMDKVTLLLDEAFDGVPADEKTDE